MMGVLNRTGTAAEPWPWALVTGGSGTDSVMWSFNWSADSLIAGENFVCAVPLEMDAATTNNEGLGTSFAGNIVVYPVYRIPAPTGLQERAAAPKPLPSPGPTSLRGVLLLPAATGAGPRTPILLLDATGRDVMKLHPGPNDVSRLASGVYFLWSATTPSLPATSATLHSTRKIVIQR
jgi:hypothetical protein